MFTISLRVRRVPLDKFRRPKLEGAKAFESTSGDGPHGSKTTNSVAKIAAGLSGVLLICGLDLVAPTSYPFQDGAAGTEAKTYWNDPNANPTTLDRPRRHRPPLLAEGRHRVVIVGGGLAGLHTALALAERIRGPSPDILVLDAHQIGQGASGRSKGLAVPGLQVPEEDLAGLCGSKDLAQKIYKLTHAAAKRLKEDIILKYQMDCNWIDCGAVEATLHQEEADDEKGENGCRSLSASEVRQLLGQPESSTLYKGGEFDPSVGGVDPLALTTGLARVLEDRWGVRIHENTRVAKVEKILPQTDDSTIKYKVTTETGAQIECQHVVLCTGPEQLSKELSQSLQHAIIPIYTWMAATPPLGDRCPLQNGLGDDSTDKMSKSPAPMCGDDFVCLTYWRRTEDGRLLFGSLADAYPVPQWLAEYRLRKVLVQVYPQLADVPFDHVWGGTLAFSRDAAPLIGRDESFTHAGAADDPSQGGVWYATCFGGHGIVPTVMAGSILADAILGLDDDTWRIFQREFPPKYTFWPVSRLGAQALLTLYNVFDWLHVKGVPVPQLPKPW